MPLDYGETWWEKSERGRHERQSTPKNRHDDACKAASADPAVRRLAAKVRALRPRNEREAAEYDAGRRYLPMLDAATIAHAKAWRECAIRNGADASRLA